MEDLWKFMWNITLSVTAFLGVFMINRSAKRLDDVDRKTNELKDEHKDCKLDIANFKLEVSQTYAKEVNMQDSLKRVHDCMERGFDEVRKDIKTLIGKK